VRNLNDFYQDEAQGSGMMRMVSRSPSVAPSGSSGATCRKSAPSPVAESSLEEEQGEEEEKQEEEEEEVGVRSKVCMQCHLTFLERPILPVNRPIIRPEGT
jgi:hypothetical protein